jgi:hypothetical protein
MRERLEREARALRVAGHSMPEVARRVDVPASTLYQWAAAGRWRGCDLAEAAARAAMDAATQAGRPGAQEGSRDEDRDEDRDEGEREDAAEAPAPLTTDQLSAEAVRCARAAMALSRSGRMKDAEAALKLAERYRELAILAADPAGEDEAAREAHQEEVARQEAAHAQAMERVKRWVRLALQGKIQQMPGWAVTKAFLADTPYAHMYYRQGGVGTGIAGHYGPGPADYLHEAGEEAGGETDGEADGEAGEAGKSGEAGGSGGSGAGAS